MKTCTKCKVENDESEFYKNRAAKDGLTHHCKKCCRKYYEDNKDEHLERQKAWAIKNKKKMQEYQKEYTLAHKEKMKEYTDSYIESLSDYYIHKNLLLRGFPRELITPDLIEFNRNMIKIKRVLKEKSKCEM